MITSTISKDVAYVISSGSLFDLEQFILHGDANEYMAFSHYNFYYSYPAWGTKRKDGSSFTFHRVEPVCLLCKQTFERNYAGVGTMYLLNNGVGLKEIRVSDGFEYRGCRKIKKSKLVPNTPRLSRMIILCRDHVQGYLPFRIHGESIVNGSRQLSLF